MPATVRGLSACAEAIKAKTLDTAYTQPSATGVDWNCRSITSGCSASARPPTPKRHCAPSSSAWIAFQAMGTASRPSTPGPNCYAPAPTSSATPNAAAVTRLISPPSPAAEWPSSPPSTSPTASRWGAYCCCWRRDNPSRASSSPTVPFSHPRLRHWAVAARRISPWWPPRPAWRGPKTCTNSVATKWPPS